MTSLEMVIFAGALAVIMIILGIGELIALLFGKNKKEETSWLWRR